MRRRAAELTGEAEGRLPVPPSRDEIARLGVHAQRDARAPAGGARARALVRLRRQPRAAHAAGDPAHRARAGAARAQHARRARGRRALGGRGDRPPQPARRRPARDRALGPGAAAGPPGRARRATSCSRASPTASPPGRAPRSARCAPRRRTASRSRPTARGSSRRWRTWSTTRCATARGDVVLTRRAATTATSSCTCATTAPASRTTSCRARSSASHAPTRRARAAAPASASRSPPRWPRAHGGEAHAATATSGGADVWLELPRPTLIFTSWPTGKMTVLPMEIPSTSPLPTGPGRTIAAGVRTQLRDRRPRRTSPMRVLVVEDEIKMASLIRRGLRSEGLAADVAIKGEDALWMAGSTTLRRDRPRRDAPGHRRLRDLPPPARGRASGRPC